MNTNPLREFLNGLERIAGHGVKGDAGQKLLNVIKELPDAFDDGLLLALQEMKREEAKIPETLRRKYLEVAGKVLAMEISQLKHEFNEGLTLDRQSQEWRFFFLSEASEKLANIAMECGGRLEPFTSYWQPGQPFGPFEILRWGGSGGGGAVFKARDTRTDEVVALKLLKPRVESTGIHAAKLRRWALVYSESPAYAPSMQEDFFGRVVPAACRVDSPNVVKTHEVSDVDGIAYWEMEMVEGEMLFSKHEREFAKEPTQGKVLLDLGIQIANGLVALHEQGISASHLAARNILVTHDMTPKIIDFLSVQNEKVATVESDLESFGELFIGAKVFDGDYVRRLHEIQQRCLKKQYRTAEELHADLLKAKQQGEYNLLGSGRAVEIRRFGLVPARDG